MSTAIDTNVIVALWDNNDTLNARAQNALDYAIGRGKLTISATVFAELLAAPARSEAFLDVFLRDTGIIVEWELREAIWRSAGRAYKTYAARRRRHPSAGPRRILADFLIGAHAQENGYGLLTLDDRLYRAAFPSLRLIVI